MDDRSIPENLAARRSSAERLEAAEPFCIVMAEDDPDDRHLAQRALQKSEMSAQICAVNNGEQLLDFLRNSGPFEGREGPPVGLILLDLNMPRMDGREALRAIKCDPDLRSIPVVVLTTSEAEQDVVESYDLGVNAYVTKPVTFDGLVEAFEHLKRFWFGTASLPPR